MSKKDNYGPGSFDLIGVTNCVVKGTLVLDSNTESPSDAPTLEIKRDSTVEHCVPMVKIDEIPDHPATGLTTHVYTYDLRQLVLQGNYSFNGIGRWIKTGEDNDTLPAQDIDCQMQP